MTPPALFEALTPLITPGIAREFGRYDDCCILATRVALEVAAYFGIEATAAAVQVVLLNRAFAAHVVEGDADIDKWLPIDGSYSVGIGCGFRPGQDRDGRWNGHLILLAPGGFADFAIRQAERLQHGIVTGPAVVGPRSTDARSWSMVHPGHGTEIHYKLTSDLTYRVSPDWRDAGRRRRISGPIIRELTKNGPAQIASGPSAQGLNPPSV